MLGGKQVSSTAQEVYTLPGAPLENGTPVIPTRTSSLGLRKHSDNSGKSPTHVNQTHRLNSRVAINCVPNGTEGASGSPIKLSSNNKSLRSIEDFKLSPPSGPLPPLPGHTLSEKRAKPRPSPLNILPSNSESYKEKVRNYDVLASSSSDAKVVSSPSSFLSGSSGSTKIQSPILPPTPYREFSSIKEQSEFRGMDIKQKNVPNDIKIIEKNNKYYI